MKHYINPITNEIFAYEADGSQDELIDPALVPITQEQLNALRESLIDPKQKVLAEIIALEITLTPRKLREAILRGDMTEIRNVDSQIAALRKQL